MGHPAVKLPRARGLVTPWLAAVLVVMLFGLAACRPDSQPVKPISATQPAAATETTAPSAAAVRSPTSTSTLIPPTASSTGDPTPVSVPATEHPPPRIISDNAARLEQVGLLRYDPWDLVLALAWSPDGSWLAVAAGNSIYIYGAADLASVQTLVVGAWTTGLAFSPDSRQLAAGSRDGELRVWHIAGAGSPFSEQPLIQWTAHKKGTNQIAFSPDGRFLASGGNDAIARVWNAADGSQVQQMIGGTFAVPALAFEPGGEFLAVVNGPLARLRELESGRLGATIRGEASLLSLDFSPEGQWIATGNLNGELEIWEVATGARTWISAVPGQAENSRPAFIGQVAYSPDGSLVGAASSDGSIRLWAPPGNRPLADLIGHSRAASCLTFDPAQTRLASGGLDGTVRIWSIP